MATRETRHVITFSRLIGAASFVLVVGLMPAHQTEASDSAKRTPVTEIKPLLMVAAEQGEAHGVLDGPGADYVRRRFDTTTPIEIDVRRLQKLPQFGCGRLEVTTRQRNVLESESRRDQILTYQVSFCSDGHFPDKR